MAHGTQVAVTGASGYIALHVIAALLDQGYSVRGTLRTMSRADQVRNALAKHTEVSNLSFAAADLTSDEGWDEAMAGCRYVMHLASPLPLLEPKDPNELIIPARDGVLRALAAAAKARVERVVMTSSIAAIGYGHDDKDHFTEADWSNPGDAAGPYASSKTIAEQAAWDFMQQLSADTKMELVTINLSVVLGPLIDPDGSASIEVVRKLMSREVPGVPKLGFSFVDVRDVATAHLDAMTTPGAAGNRYICSTQFGWMAELAHILNDTFGPQGKPVRTRVLPDLAVRMVALFDPAVRRIVPDLGRQSDYDNAAIRKDLNWQPRPLKETVIATGESLIEHGII